MQVSLNILPYKSVKNIKEIVGSTDLLRKGHAFLSQRLCKDQTCFVTILTSWVLNDAEFFLGFQKYKLTEATKCPYEVQYNKYPPVLCPSSN
jgi:hypothetical protein